MKTIRFIEQQRLIVRFSSLQRSNPSPSDPPKRGSVFSITRSTDDQKRGTECQTDDSKHALLERGSNSRELIQEPQPKRVHTVPLHGRIRRHGKRANCHPDNPSGSERSGNHRFLRPTRSNEHAYQVAAFGPASSSNKYR